VDEATADADDVDIAEPEVAEADVAEPESADSTDGPRDVLSAFDAMILDDVVAEQPVDTDDVGEPTASLPAVDQSAVDESPEDESPEDEDDLSEMPPPSVTAPSDMPPPSMTESAPAAPPFEPLPDRLIRERKRADDLVLDPRAMKALSRQERKDAKAAIRREAKEAREAARRARAEAKAEAKADLTDDVETESASDRPTEHIDPVTEAAELLAEPPADMPPPAVVTPEVATPAQTPVSSAPPPNMPPPAPTGTDPRSRAAARVQRRLGRDAEKVSAAETRARAREEARRRRVQAKELRTGSAAAEAAEAVVRMPEERLDATAEIPAVNDELAEAPVIETAAVEDAETRLIPSVAETPEVLDEIDLGDDVPADDALEESEPADEDGDADEDADFEDVEGLEDPEADAAEFVAPSNDDPIFDEAEFDAAGVDEPAFDESESISTQPAPDDMPAPVVASPAVKPASLATTAPKWTPEPEEPTKKSGLGPAAGVIGLIALAISVLLAVSALAVALGVDSGGVYNVLKAIADTLVGPLKSAFDFSGSNADRKEHFLAWGAGSLGYLIVSFIGQAVQRANSDDE